MAVKPDDILDFWEKAGPKAWFSKNDEFDAEMSEKFGAFHSEAAEGKHNRWADAADPALALILVLDQFSRNMFRNDARSFSQDPLCCKIATQALDNQFDDQCRPALRSFFYMPFMHSESILDQQRCVELMMAHGGPDNVSYAITHRDIIKRFGRFPHRNSVLGRHTTPAELEFLNAGGFSG